jgi:hypothetical protein
VSQRSGGEYPESLPSSRAAAEVLHALGAVDAQGGLQVG